MRDCHLWWDGFLLERGRQYLPASFLARTSIQGHPPGGYGPTFQPYCPSCPMHGVGIVATHGGSSAFSSLISLISHIDPLFHPYPWTIAVPVLTDFLFLVDKGNPVLLACKAPAQWHSLSSCVSRGATHSSLNSLLSLPKPPFPSRLCLEGPPPPTPLPFSLHGAAWVPVCSREVLSFLPTSLAWFSASHMCLSSCASLI